MKSEPKHIEFMRRKQILFTHSRSETVDLRTKIKEMLISRTNLKHNLKKCFKKILCITFINYQRVCLNTHSNEIPCEPIWSSCKWLSIAFDIYGKKYKQIACVECHLSHIFVILYCCIFIWVRFFGLHCIRYFACSQQSMSNCCSVGVV